MPKEDSPGQRAGDDRQYLPMSLPQDKPDNKMDLYDVAYPRPFYQVPCQSCGALAEWGEDDDYEHVCVQVITDGGHVCLISITMTEICYF